MNEITIIVNTCDAYEDIWELFFRAFLEYWPNCKYNIILNTENKKIKSATLPITTHNYRSLDGKDKWGFRLRETLNKCETKYVVMLYDDFILEGAVDQWKILNCVKWLNENLEVAVFYFLNISTNVNLDDGRFDDFELLPKYGDYKLNSAPAIWRREALLKFVGIHDNPWAWEYFGSYRTYSGESLFYCTKKNCENIYPYNYKMGGAIYRGKWVYKIVQPLMDKYGLNIDVAARGVADEVAQNNKRSLRWKIDFFIIGFKMIKFGICVFMYRIFKNKCFK